MSQLKDNIKHLIVLSENADNAKKDFDVAIRRISKEMNVSVANLKKAINIVKKDQTNDKILKLNEEIDTIQTVKESL